MTGTVELPLWLVVLALILAAIAALDRILVPSARWFLRRRMERIVAHLNTRLDRPIRPFKLMRHADMVIRLVHDPKVMEAVVAEAKAAGEPESVVFERARRYAREIVPSFSASLYFGVATRAARWLATMLYRVRIGHFEGEALGRIEPDATVVFVMNHRSNMDYVLVTYLAADRSALSYAVGEWARVWPLSSLIRSMGAYFIRRRSNTPLYRRVLSRYVQIATEEGVTQAIYPEGGLSLDGRVGKARVGLLSYIAASHRPEGPDIVFIPVALSYDRVLEDRVLTEAAQRGERRFRAPIRAILAFGLRHLWRRLRGRYRRFGYAAVSFGAPLSLREFQAARPDAVAEDLAEELMRRVLGVVTILPVPLAAAAARLRPEGSRDEVLAEAERLAARLRAAGAHLHPPGEAVRAAADAGLAMLVRRQLLLERGGRLLPNPAEAALLDFYAALVFQRLDAAAAIPSPQSGASAEVLASLAT